MARRRISLGQFRVYNDGNYGGGSNLDHSYRRCDWEVCIDGWTPAEITRAARAHARECDGKPQPVAETVAETARQSVASSLVPEEWTRNMIAAFQQQMLYGYGSSAP
jgi:hypothetical protein